MSEKDFSEIVRCFDHPHQGVSIFEFVKDDNSSNRQLLILDAIDKKCIKMGFGIDLKRRSVYYVLTGYGQLLWEKLILPELKKKGKTILREVTDCEICNHHEDKWEGACSGCCGIYKAGYLKDAEKYYNCQYCDELMNKPSHMCIVNGERTKG